MNVLLELVAALSCAQTVLVVLFVNVPVDICSYQTINLAQVCELCTELVN